MDREGIKIVKELRDEIYNIEKANKVLLNEVTELRSYVQAYRNNEHKFLEEKAKLEKEKNNLNTISANLKLIQDKITNNKKDMNLLDKKEQQAIKEMGEYLDENY